jgi:hypothetical protein
MLPAQSDHDITAFFYPFQTSGVIVKKIKN